MTKILIGADPELFLYNDKGKFISSVGLFGGTKHKPRLIGHDCAVQEDNVAVEFNIPPAETADKFIESCTYALQVLTKEASEKGLFLSLAASKSFDKDQLESDAAKTFGCDPDLNAWTRKKNPPPQAKDPNLRSAGGHVHIATPFNKLMTARWCDVTLGLASVIEDADTARRELYGQAGSFRIKPYGIEYRTLSNYWLKSPELMKKIFERAHLAVAAVKNGFELKDKDGSRIQAAINTSNTALADELLSKYSKDFGLKLEVA